MPDRQAAKPRSASADCAGGTPGQRGATGTSKLPSTNSLAVLGLLATAPMTAYGLAVQTRRALDTSGAAAVACFSANPLAWQRRG